MDSAADEPDADVGPEPLDVVALALLAAFIVLALVGGWLIRPAVGLLACAGACLITAWIVGSE